MDQFDVVVAGAGVVGLAVARALSTSGLAVLVLERAGSHGAGISSRSSEVIHAGLYGQPGTLKARLCVRGRALLMDFCRTHGVDHRRCGKLVVATPGQDESALEDLQASGRANGVDDLVLLSARAAMAMEPALRCVAALHSPSSGIVDSHGLMTALLADAQAHGAVVAMRDGLRAAVPCPVGWQVTSDTGFGLQTRWIVNAAGLGAQALAGALAGFPPRHIPARHLAAGRYFALARRAPFRHLIYPLPVARGLGIHLTLDLAGQARFGPDVAWLVSDAAGDALDYSVDPGLIGDFEDAIRRYWPGLPDAALAPGYCGIRPKLSGPGEPAADFRIDGPSEHGCAGIVQLFGIESPGLTASLAIAERVADIICSSDA